MIVAAGASDCQTEEALGNHVYAVVDDVVGHLHESVAERQETEGAQIARVAGG